MINQNCEYIGMFTLKWWSVLPPPPKCLPFTTHKLVPLISAFGGESHLRTEASQWQVGPDLQAALEVRLADVDDW